MIAKLLNRILGQRCRLGCGQRVFPADVAEHERLEHNGDKATTGSRR